MSLKIWFSLNIIQILVLDNNIPDVHIYIRNKKGVLSMCIITIKSKATIFEFCNFTILGGYFTDWYIGHYSMNFNNFNGLSEILVIMSISTIPANVQMYRDVPKVFGHCNFLLYISYKTTIF